MQDAKDIMASEEIQTIQNNSDDNNNIQFDFKMLNVAIKHSNGEILEAIEDLYRMLEQLKDDTDKEKIWIILTRLSSYLVERKEFESALVLQDRLLNVLNCQNILETCLKNSPTNHQDIYVEDAKIESFTRSLLVLLHTSRIQLYIGDPTSANRLVDVVETVRFTYLVSFFFF